MEQVIELFSKFIEQVSTLSSGRFIALVGCIILFSGLYFCYLLIKKDPESIKGMDVFSSIFSVVVGTVALACGSAVILSKYSKETLKEFFQIADEHQRIADLRFN